MNAYRLSIVFGVTIIVFSVFMYQTWGIKCWYCNSMLDPYCSDPFDNSTATPRNCSIQAYEPIHLRGVPANMCRKIRMKIYGQWRFKRDCARLGEVGVGGDERYCIYRTGTYNIHMEYCTCNDKDGCNSAQSHKFTVSLGISLLFGLFMLISNPITCMFV